MVFSLMYKRYLGVLGASTHGNTSKDRNSHAERQAYDALRKSLRGGSIASRLYTDWLTKFLDAVDRFFGDAGTADRTLFPRAFGLRTPAPLWTAPAFDRCLLLAMIYPIVTIFIIWAVSGHVGPAEAALEFKPDIAGWRRGISLGIFVVVAFAFRRVVVAGPAALLPRILALVVVVVFVVVFVVVLVAGTGVGALIVALIGVVVGAGAVVVLGGISIKYRWQGLFLLLFSVGMVVICLGAANLLSPGRSWHTASPALLFLGLLTLINAPFDWASLGLTRALLRRGLELGGWWPYFLALVDALAAAVIIAVLAITMVIGVQTFDHLAEHYGGADARILPLDTLFDGIAAQPSAPEYWWVYALLLSTMIPSLLNLMIGGASLLRGVPGLPVLLLRFMPASKAVPAFDRTWLALVLTCQVFVGAFLGIAAQFVLAIGVIFYVLPWMGLELLDTARAVADFDLPMRVLRLWWG